MLFVIRGPRQAGRQANAGLFRQDAAFSNDLLVDLVSLEPVTLNDEIISPPALAIVGFGVSDCVLALLVVCPPARSSL